MEKTPRGMRLHIGIFGKRNAGKSTLLNCITAQQTSIVSDTPGTTTDPVSKPMELLPLGPVLFIDTAGIDDIGALGEMRIKKTEEIIQRTDLAIIVSDYNGWDNFEKELYHKLQELKIPTIVVINKIDIAPIAEDKLSEIQALNTNIVQLSAINKNSITLIKEQIIKNTPEDFFETKILSDLIPPQSLVVFVIPIDKEAPKGRIILPQVQAIRDILDGSQICMVCKTSELELALNSLKNPPALVVTDSQDFATVNKIVPTQIKLTSFSTLFARLKGDFESFLQGATTIDHLQENDKILIAESCTHHPIGDDIGRIKIPALLQKKVGKKLQFEVYSGHDFPQNLDEFKLIIHCGGCMTNKREILSRVLKAKNANVPITNYGMTIAKCLNILDRATEIFKAKRS